MQSVDLVKLISDLTTRIENVELEIARLNNFEVSDFRPPTAQQVTDAMTLEGKRIDAEAFLAHYQSQGWQKGNGLPIKDWQAAARAWVIRSQTDEKFVKPEAQHKQERDERWAKLCQQAAKGRP